jgi:hypothetical protein
MDKSTDDLHTYRAIPVPVISHGCAGEFCAGPDSDHPCAACRNGTVRTDSVYQSARRALQMHIW